MASQEANSDQEFEDLLTTAPSARRADKPVPKRVRVAQYQKAPIRVRNLYDETVDYTVSPAPPQQRPKASRVRHDVKRTRLSEFGFDSYDEYLQSSHWLKKRRELLRSDRMYACISCGKTKGLHVHHRTYNHLGDEPLGDLDYLCERCHDLAHKASRTLAGVDLWNCSRMVANLIRLGFGSDRFDEKSWNQHQTKKSNISRVKSRPKNPRRKKTAGQRWREKQQRKQL